MNACCGHGGNAEGAYIQFWNKEILSGDTAIKNTTTFKNNNLKIKLWKNLKIM